jgi:hypothetical protein
VFPGQLLDVLVDDVLEAAKTGDRAAQTARNCYSIPGFASSDLGTKAGAEMESALFKTMRMLEEARLHFFIERTRPDAIRLSVTLVGERVEIDVFEDNHLEISRFFGDEKVEGGMELLLNTLKTI